MRGAPREKCVQSLAQRQEGGMNLGKWGGTLSRDGVWKDPEESKAPMSSFNPHHHSMGMAFISHSSQNHNKLIGF